MMRGEKLVSMFDGDAKPDLGSACVLVVCLGDIL